MNVYVSVCILLCFYKKSVNKRWKRIRNHLKVIVSFYEKCIIPYKNHNKPEKGIPFVVTFHPRLKILQKIIDDKNLYLLHMNEKITLKKLLHLNL